MSQFVPKLALITGATSGFGLATAWALAREGCNLILTGRRRGRLEEIKKTIEVQTKAQVDIFDFDVSDRAKCEKIVSENQRLFFGVDVLINNAGLAKGLDTFAEADLDHFDAMIDTNVKGLIYITRQILPFMIQNQRGHIINIGSVAGQWVYPKGSVYCASKFAVSAISEGLRMDVIGTPIRVTNIQPGMAETEFSQVRLGDSDKAKKVYEGMKPLTAEDIAECIVWCLNRPPHVNIQELTIFPTDQASVHHVHRK